MTTSTPRLDSLTAGGTDHHFDGIRLADGNMLTLNVRPGAETAEVFLLPGLTAPDTEAWENEDDWEVWLTGGEFGDGSLYGDVPVEAVRDLIAEHGGEHENQEPPQESPAGTDEDDTAEAIATRALDEWGITAHRDDDAGNTWLAIGHDQTRAGFPRMLAEPYVVLYLYTDSDGEDEEITVTRAPADGDVWDVVRGDGTGAECAVMTRPADQLAACVEAIADWLTMPQITPDPVIRLAELNGTFAFGYGADDVRSVFGRIADEGGPRLVCVWEYADDFGYGGNSVFYVEDQDGGLFEVSPDVRRWLTGQQQEPGPLNTWTGPRAYEPWEFPISDDFHNYARADRPE
ncbi:hypothetical protein [Streptomyces sp. NPDC001744]|uniref:hypothetical protein n=1 Tax=Streptomyces sp. NPDC001744 TaxID=3364606 RepID=UPI00367D4F1F